jgi:hypothetical protein
MNRKQPVNGFGTQLCVATATFVGAGASAPTVATTAQHNAGTNAASSATRGAQGVYTLVLKADVAIPRVMHVIASVVGSSKQANVTTDYVAATRTVIVTVLTAAGAAVDLTASTDFLKLTLIGQDSTS